LKLSHRITNWLQKRGLLAEHDSWLVRHFGRAVSSGVNVTENSSLYSTAVFASVRLLGGTIASLPLPVYRRLEPRGKARQQRRPEYKLLHDRPNPEVSSFQWRQTGIAHQLLYGDWFNELVYERGNIKEIWPIPPWRVKVEHNPKGDVFYEVSLPDGGTATIPSWKMLHVKNLSIDGLRGMSCIRAGAEAIGLSMAAEEFGAKFFSQGANMSGVAEHPGKLSDTAYDRLKKELPEKYAGLGNAHRIMLLEEGMKFQRIGIPPNEAQFLETRKFQVAEIGRLFGISQLHKIGDLERATFSNIEQQNIDFVVDTIRPLIVNIEQEINYKLFNGKDYFTEFVIDGLLRGDIQSRYAAYAVGRQWGWHSANDILELENQNPIGEQGDIYLIPMNMVPADEAKNRPEPQEPPPPAPDDRSLNLSKEERSRQAALTRARTAKGYEKLFQEAAQKVCTREKNHVVKALNKHIGERSITSFNEWLDDFYREFVPFVERTMRPAVTGLAEAIRGIAISEVGTDAGAVAGEVERAVNEYMEAQNYAHTERSRAVVKQLIRRAEEENLDAVALVTERMEDWEENRPALIASDSTVAVSSKIAKAVFVGAGIQRLRWVSIGGNSCPLCEELNNRVVGIEQPFVARDDTLEAEGTSNYTVSKPTMEPPLHKGCVCEIVAD